MKKTKQTNRKGKKSINTFFVILHLDVPRPTSDGLALPLDDAVPVGVDWAIGISCGTSK